MAAANGVLGVSGWTGTATGELTLSRSSAALLWLNLLDGIFTLFFLQLGVAEEANPVMRLAYEHSPLTFMAVKLAVVHAGVLLLTITRSAPPARIALKAGAALYAAIVLYHLALLVRLLCT